MTSSRNTTLVAPPSTSTLVLHAGFVFTGVVSNLLGALLPLLSSRWALDDARAGYFFMTQFSAMLAGNLVSGRCVARFGIKRVLATGFVLMAAGVSGIVADGWMIAIASVFLYGLGLGVTIPPTNLFIAEMNPRRSAAALNVLNMAWVTGAVVGPPLITFFAQKGNFIVPQILIVVSLSGIAIRFLYMALVSRTMIPRMPAGAEDPVESVWRSPVAFLIGALIFLYVGTETALAGWIATYTQRQTEAPPAAWALAQPAFWATVLAGRAIAPLALRRMAGDRLVLASLTLASCGTALLMSGTGLSGHWFGIALAGAGMAAVFPTTVALYSQFFGARAARSVGQVFGLGGLGGASLPWLVGFVSSVTGSLRTGMFVPLSALLGMIVLQLFLIPFLSRTLTRGELLAAKQNP